MALACYMFSVRGIAAARSPPNALLGPCADTRHGLRHVKTVQCASRSGSMPSSCYLLGILL